MVSQQTQTLSLAPLVTVYEEATASKPPVVTYSKAVQTSEIWTSPHRQSKAGEEDDEEWSIEAKTPRTSKRLSRRDRERDEELRQNIRREIEQELRAVQVGHVDGVGVNAAIAQQNFPARTLTDEELAAVTNSDGFLEFIEQSSKVIERALEQEYDILTDYAHGASGNDDDETDGYGRFRNKKGRRVKEIAQFYDERWSKRRMLTGIDFSPKFPELILGSYTKSSAHPNDPVGLVQVWNQHTPARPEYTFHAPSDVLVAKFSPFHPNTIVGGTYSGQVLLWDTRARATPVQRTPLTGSGHTHPVYSIDIVGTQNANNIISCSTDGVVCSWSVDMLAQPQEYLELQAPDKKTEEVAPTCIAFPKSDPTYFLAGTEEGTIYPCHRYDRAGAKAGVDTRVAYRGHAAPVMSVDFHTAKGPVDLGDLVVSTSVDWSVKIWKVRPPAAVTASAVATGGVGGVGQNVSAVSPLLEIQREDLVYDARWSPVRPGVFALVDGKGDLEVWDVGVDVEVPVAKVTPTDKTSRGVGRNSLNKVAWEHHHGRYLATGGLDGVISLFEVGPDLGGSEGVRAEEWSSVKKAVSRWDSTPSISTLSLNGR